MNRMTKGLPQRCARQLYLAVAAPRITYAADVWYTPLHENDRTQRTVGMSGLTRKLNAIQRVAAIAITGALSTAAGDAAMIHADLYDAGLTLLDTCHRASTRLAALPDSHPLKPHIKRVAQRVVKNHMTSLHILFALTAIDPKTTETINPTLLPPNLDIPILTTIDIQKEHAITCNAALHNGECVLYANGSGFENGIGASAVLYEDGIERGSLKFNLGSTEEHTVFEGEVAGILLGLHMVEKKQIDTDKIVIFVDNQVAIQSITKCSPTPSQYLVNAVQEAIKRLEDYKIEIHWTPGHEGVVGNECADELAKEAAKGESSNTVKNLPTRIQAAAH